MPSAWYLRAVLFLITAISATLLACTAEPPPAHLNATQLVRGNGPEPDSLDPQRARNVESGNVLRDLYEGLTTVGRDGGPVPGVAKAWRVSANGLRWTFDLRAEARWSNGEAVVAEDFVVAMRRLVDPAMASQYAQIVDTFLNASEIISNRKSPSTLGVYAIDPHTIVIFLSTPTPYLPSLMSHWSVSPVHRPSLEKYGNAFVKPRYMVSNGAYILNSWVQGAQIDVTRNTNYWNNKATKIEKVRWLSQANEMSEYKLFRSGELHVTYTLPRGQFEEIQRVYGKQLYLGPQLGSYFYGLNLDREPFKSKQGLRRALSLVIDRERIVKFITRVGELPGYSWVPPGTFDYTSQFLDYAQQSLSARIVEAQVLYKSAGYSKEKPLNFELRYNSGEMHSRIAVAVAEMWKKTLGVQVSLVAVDFKVLQQDINARNVDVFRLSWIGDYNDPYTFLQYFKSDFGINTTHFKNVDYDLLLKKAAMSISRETRRAKLEAAEALLLQEHPLIPLYHYVNKHLVSQRVHGWYSNAMNVVYSRELELRND